MPDSKLEKDVKKGYVVWQDITTLPPEGRYVVRFKSGKWGMANYYRSWSGGKDRYLWSPPSVTHWAAAEPLEETP